VYLISVADIDDFRTGNVSNNILGVYTFGRRSKCLFFVPLST